MRAYLNISLFSYMERPIFDVKMNGSNFGAALEHSFYGSNAVMVMQPISLGPQIVTWRLAGPKGAPRNGELVTAKNQPLLSDVPKDIKWLALHVYDDDTVEIKLSRGTSEELQTQRGRKIIEAGKSKDAR
jgi:hypothetical protein